MAALAGCASLDSGDPYASAPIARHLERDDDVGYCARLFADIDRRVDALGVRDAEAPRVPGYPYLRVDRFAQAIAANATSEEQRQTWIARLAALDDAGRTAELQNADLPADDLARCRVMLASADAATFDDVRARARVPDDYDDLLRGLGLYPVTKYAFAHGVRGWQEDTRAVFATPLDKLAAGGQLTRYGVRTATPVPDVTLPGGRDVLGVPLLSRFDRTALLLRHAPVLEIDTRGAADKPGALALDADDLPTVNERMPMAYTRVSHAIFDDGVHIQLVYTFWFDERPATNPFDPLAGRIDGLVWRVTLDRDGTPLVYDTIHPCGCYHLFFPTPRARARPAPDSVDEGMFSPQAVRAPGRDEVVVVRIAAGTHYVQRVRIEPRRDPAVRYQLADDHLLTTLPRHGSGTRSAYGGDGLMPGTERGERFFFWPTGVTSAGQMRQWGHHATAFVGRRHFDDPLLLGSYFAVRPEAPATAAP